MQRLLSLSPRPTAESIVLGHNLRDKCAVITGGTAGLGLATAQALVGANAHVIIASRNKGKGEAIAIELDRQCKVAVIFSPQLLRESLGGGTKRRLPAVQGKAQAVSLDLRDVCSLPQRAEEVQSLSPHIDYLILNAGVDNELQLARQAFSDTRPNDLC